MTIHIKKSSLTPFLDALFRFRRATRPHIFLTYCLALCLAIVGVALRVGLNALSPTGLPFITFFPIVTIAAFLLGAAPAIFCAVIYSWAAWFYFTGVDGAGMSQTEAVSLGYFIFVILVEVLIVDQLFYYVQEYEQERERALEHARQRDLLFTELQHRVGNNLAVVSSMLNLQARAIESQSAKLALLQSAGRIRVISDINRMFHDPTRVDGVFDEKFVGEIVAKCLDAYGAKDRVTAKIEVQSLALGQDYFLPLALILTECVNNALEHGIGDNCGALAIEAAPLNSPGRWRLQVRDDGGGVAADFDLESAKSIGLNLVKYFSQKLNGRFKIYSEGGVVSELVFEVPRHYTPV